ncbi:LAME_0F06348g1_1 [Lachancea meyersii CBS 8951]|uniref:LAME_0F06348g1_1 n=1 Tax=Lachancea meyersii CBS 8951 TaxID=1266667 RepID=A0A1G4JTD9_9SACH|nr:LAME_0F06348g1_1 [Lachancea meyersii CBS 8951]
MIVPRKIGHSRRLYSGAISQDFLKNVLERVKETAAKKPIQNRPNPRSRAPRRARENDESGRNNYGKKAGSRNANFNQGPVINDSNMSGPSGSGKPGINATLINRQPQFRRRRAGAGASATGEMQSNNSAIMDALDSSEGARFNTRKSQQLSNSSGKRNRAPRTGQRTVPGLTNASFTMEGIVAQAKKSAASEQYSPDEPTPLGLLKYAPNLSHSSFSKLNKYGLFTLQENDFPLTRPINLGLATSPSEKPRNVSLSPNVTSFGKYTPASSVAWRREKLLKNVVVSPDVSQFETMVEGKYVPLSPTSEKDFATLSKNAKKRGELVQNSDLVRLSLERSNMDMADKDLVYNVCSGLQPVSQLRA